MADQSATVEIQARSAGLAAQLREAAAKFDSFADGVVANMTKKTKKKKDSFGKDAISKMIGTAGGNLLSGGISKATGYVEDAAESAFSFEENLTRLQITAEATPDAMRAFAGSIDGASKKTGKNRNEILAAASSYVALTGDMDTAAKSIDTWTTVAQATNSTVSDIAGAAAALKQQMNIGPGDMLEVFGSLAKQGKLGAIEIKDLAAQLSNIAPMWSEFAGGQGARGVRELGAALQIAKRGFGGDAGETVTGIQGMLVAFERHAKKFGEHGIKIFEADGKTKKNVFDIVDAISKKKLGGTELIDIFGRVEGMRAYQQLAKFNDELKKMATAGEGAAMIGRDFDTFITSPAGRTEQAMNHLKESIAATFTPERIERFAAELEKVVGYAEQVVHFMSGFTKEEETKGDVANLVDIQQGNASTEFVGGSGEAQAIAYANYIKNLKGGAPGSTESRIKTGKEIEYGITSDAADQYLASVGGARGIVAQGTDPAAIAFQQGFYSMAPARAFGSSSSDVAKVIAKAITDGLSQIQIQMDGSKVGKVTKDAHSHRRDVKK